MTSGSPNDTKPSEPSSAPANPADNQEKWREQFRQDIQRLSREPFRNTLAEFLLAAPSAEAVKAFADKAPDRWAQAIAILAKAAGYHESVIGGFGSKSETNIYLQLQSKSDAEIMVELENTLRTLGMPLTMLNKLDPRHVIDAEFVPVKEEGPEGP